MSKPKLCVMSHLYEPWDSIKRATAVTCCTHRLFKGKLHIFPPLLVPCESRWQKDLPGTWRCWLLEHHNHQSSLVWCRLTAGHYLHYTYAWCAWTEGFLPAQGAKNISILLPVCDLGAAENVASPPAVERAPCFGKGTVIWGKGSLWLSCALGAADGCGKSCFPRALCQT